MASSSVAADMELDRPNLEDYLQSVSLPQEAPHYLHLRDLLDISPVLTQAAGAIVDMSWFMSREGNLNAHTGKWDLVNSTSESTSRYTRFQREARQATTLVR
ncbi:uncharacterized protein LOC8069464 isoform X2 [Sorghum bicolor]|uniref:uncharacterized protein LOC8069464 isoform X2 n=1 Tax=Sorghum bicolor TaxID=4558 RepID=UPI000B426369|nr:uncharacterized protein LOC8069464 isoform X2 [Sorghum bicolor]|eukprot:XP_021318876.1 uncharacterized protein LOC8069464 isoform X2 [Sorghum bicolor]